MLGKLELGRKKVYCTGVLRRNSHSPTSLIGQKLINAVGHTYQLLYADER